jgi:hypothetical protein
MKVMLEELKRNKKDNGSIKIVNKIEIIKTISSIASGMRNKRISYMEIMLPVMSMSKILAFINSQDTN